MLQRKHVDASEVHPFFHPHQKDGKVYVTKNEPTLCGIDIAVEHFQEQFELQQHKKKVARTPNDSLRLACIVLDPKHRDSASTMMTKKKNRPKSDITGDSNLHFFEKILDEAFLNPSYVVSTENVPHCEEFPEDEKVNWDPNDPCIFEQARAATWLKETWDAHLKKKHKGSLDRWNKLTGGGDGASPSFIDCCLNDRWLAWVFVLDEKSKFLLANDAGGRMPKHLQFEAGFEATTDVSSITDNDDLSGEKTLSAGDLESELVAAKKQRVGVNLTLEKVMKKLDETDSPLKKIAAHSKMMTDNDALGTVDAPEQQKCISAIEKKRKKTLDSLDTE